MFSYMTEQVGPGYICSTKILHPNAVLSHTLRNKRQFENNVIRERYCAYKGLSLEFASPFSFADFIVRFSSLFSCAPAPTCNRSQLFYLKKVCNHILPVVRKLQTDTVYNLAASQI